MDLINDEMQLLGFHNINELSHSHNDNDQTSNKGSIWSHSHGSNFSINSNRLMINSLINRR